MRTHTWPLRRALTVLSALLITAFAGACASAGNGTASGQDGIPIVVSNNLIPSLTVNISAVTEGTTPVRLGSLVAGAEETFTYRPTVSGGTFRLIADRPGPGGALVSEPIPLAADATTRVEWELSTNNIIVR